MTRIIGIDPGLETVGYAVLDVVADKYTLITSGVIKTSKKSVFPNRLFEIHGDISELLKKWCHTDTVISIEKLFFGVNVQTAMNVAHARGCILAAIGQWNKVQKIHEYAPTTIKKVVTGHGHAKKAAIRAAIKKQLGADIKEDNACDAAAIALCHALIM